jgi:hypothetical protein
MAKTPRAVIDFLQDLRPHLVQVAKKEIAHLMEIKKADLKGRGLEDSDDGNYYLWDHRFYNRLMREQTLSIDEQTVAEYFPLKSTVQGMLGVIEDLFGFIFEEIKLENRIKLSGAWPKTSSFSNSNFRQRTAKMTLYGTEMSRSLVFGMTRMRAARLSVSYTSICIGAKENKIMRPTSHCSQATSPLSGRVDILVLRLSATSLNRPPPHPIY